MEVFLHRRAIETEFIDINLEDTVRDFSNDCIGEGAIVWLEEAEEALDPDKTLAEIGITERCHLHVSKCVKVAVKVRFGGDSIEGFFFAAHVRGINPEMGCEPGGIQANRQ